MTERALLLTGDIRCLLAGAAALTIGVVTFLLLAVLAVVTSAVSGAWLALPSLLMVGGVAAVTAWLVSGGEARRSAPVPIAAEQWRWTTTGL